MALSKQDFLDMVHDVLEPFMLAAIKEEVANQVHAAAMRVLYEEGGHVVREAIRKEIDRRVSIEVRVKD